MKSYSERTVKVTLELDEEEAQWLRELTQNSQSVGEETTRENTIRQKFWRALENLRKVNF